MNRKTKGTMSKEIKTLKKAMKLKCYDCQCGQKRLDCKMEDCPLYIYRPFKHTTIVDSDKDN